MFEVLFGDDARGDVMRIEFRALDQMEQQVERAFVDRQPKAERTVVALESSAARCSRHLHSSQQHPRNRVDNRIYHAPAQSV